MNLNLLEKELNKQHKEDKAFVMPNTPLKISMLDNPTYYEPKHSVYLQRFLKQVELGEIDRLAITMPPRHNKSELTSLYWIIYMIHKYPTLKIAIASYNTDFASRWVRKVRDFLLEFTPELLNQNKATMYEFETVKGGFVMAVSPTSTLVGRGINLLLLDDLIKTSEEANSPAIQRRNKEWYESVATTRLEPYYSNGKVLDPAIIMIGTIWNTQDLLWTIPDSSWVTVRLPAIAEDNDPIGRKKGEALWPERFPLKDLLKKKKEHGRYYWSSMYCCQALSYGGNVLREDWIQYKDFKEDDCLKTVMTIDPAISTLKTADDTALCLASLMTDKSILIRSMEYGKWDFHTQIKKISGMYNMYKPDQIISEAISYQRALAEALIKDCNIPVHQIKSRGNKIDRILSLIPFFESGKIFLTKGSWNEYFLDQYTAWSPENKNSMDDLLDALEENVNTLSKMVASNVYGSSGRYDLLYERDRNDRPSYQYFRRFYDD